MTAPASPSGPPRDDVRLEPVTLAHADVMFRWMSDPDVRDNVGLRTDPTPEKTREWIRVATDNKAIRAFAVLRNGLHVGNVVLDRIDPRTKLARLSIYVGERSARGAGVGRSAVMLALRVAFDDLALHKVCLTVLPDNEPAIALYERVGFKREGVLREEALFRGRRVDEIYMGILRQEAVAAGVLAGAI